jgi:PAS domain S-box-containing protein
MVHPEDRDTVRRHVARVLAGEDVLPIEHRILHRNGTTRWVRHAIVQRHDAAGSPVGYDGLLEDITEYHDLVKSFQCIMDSVPDAIVIVDADGRVVLVNAQAERTFGQEQGALLGQSLTALIPNRFHQEHSQNAAAYVAALHLRPMGAGSGFVGLRKDGTEFPAEISLGPLETQHGIHVVCIIRDVSERERATHKIARNLEIQKVIGAILHDSQESIPLRQFLELVLDRLLSVSWMTVESRGAIFLIEGNRAVLNMKAQRGLSLPLVKECRQVPVGTCLCGRAAMTRQIVFASHVDERHEVS